MSSVWLSTWIFMQKKKKIKLLCDSGEEKERQVPGQKVAEHPRLGWCGCTVGWVLQRMGQPTKVLECRIVRKPEPSLSCVIKG